MGGNAGNCRKISGKNIHLSALLETPEICPV
jgi:hypothetical protein